MNTQTTTPTPEEQMGMNWWNGMSHRERMEVLRQSNALIRGASVAQAWRFWKSNRISMSPPNAEFSDKRLERMVGHPSNYQGLPKAKNKCKNRSIPVDTLTISGYGVGVMSEAQ